MPEIKDKLWIWGHEAGSHNDQYGIKYLSRMTPAEGASYLGVPNMIMVRYANKPEPPFDQYAMAFEPLKKVVWSIIGDGSSSGNDLAEVLDLAQRFPNISGAIMDDFFERRNPETGKKELSPYTPDELSDIRKQLTVSGRKLDLWVVLYNGQLNLPVGEYLKQCDVVTFWTWRSEEIKNLEQNFERAEKLSSSCRKVLGCYMYDYGDGKPMSVSLMEKQCELGLRWLQEGRVEGIIFLASCICDLELEAVEWTRQWIQEAAEESLR